MPGCPFEQKGARAIGQHVAQKDGHEPLRLSDIPQDGREIISGAKGF